MTPVLEIAGLRKHFRQSRARGGGLVRAVDGVDLSIGEGEIVGLVGESGCGKTTVGRCVLRLLDPDAGRVVLDGTDITKLGPRALRPLRRQMHMVFQDPYSSLNPRMQVGEIVAEPMRTHRLAGRGEIDRSIAELLTKVGLSPQVRTRYPHELSGGQRQRVGLARSLALGPRLLVADEPVSALDVSVQAAIINLLLDLHRDIGFSCLFISHDLATVEFLCDRIAVMYLGRIVEIGTREQVLGSPKHPYTQALLSAVVEPDPARQRKRHRVLLEGDVPSPLHPPSGCPFHTRCPVAEPPRCRDEDPAPVTVGDGNWARCHFVHPDGRAPDVAAETGSHVHHAS